MEFLISKLLPIFVYPLGGSIVLLILGLLLGRYSALLRRFLLGAALVSLWVSSMPAFTTWIVRSLEDRYPPLAIDQVMPVDFIVLLGGLLSDVRRPGAPSDMRSEADRLWHTVRLFRAGKAPKILVSGGNIKSGKVAEAVLLKPLLLEMGVPASAILLESRSRNTRENALYSAIILGRLNAKRVLLVTSAAHMRRAVAAFSRAGVAVIPAATDYRAPVADDWGQFSWLPQAWALEQSTEAIKEYIGFWYYQMRGWA